MFYGWWIVASVFMAQLFMTGFFSYCFPLFVVPVQNEFGASVTDVMWSLTGAGFAGLFISPLFGTLVDRWSARGLMLIGALCLVLGLCLLSVSRSVIEFAVIFALIIGSATTLLGPITGSALVSRWFTTSRGRALGVAAIGTSIGGMVLPAIMSGWIESLGWRAALQALAAMVAVAVLPLLIFALRNYPSDKGLEPEGAVEGAAATQMQTGDARIWTNVDILRALPFWLISGCLGLLFMSYTAVLSNLGKFVETLELDPSIATTLISTIAACGLVGKLVFGALADRMPLRVGLWIALALAIVGIALLSTEPTQPLLILAAVLMGLATGGMLPVWGALVAAVFGVASFGRAMGLITPVIGLLVMPGFMIAGKSRDLTGSYATAMQIFVVSLIVAALLLIPLRIGTGAQAETGEASAD